MIKRSVGFTLVELLVSMAGVVVLLALAVESYSYASSAAKAATARTDLHEALTRAQREALVRYQHVVLCSTAGGDVCQGSVVWEHGWIAFEDLNRDRERQPEERLVFAHRSAEGGVRIRSSRTRTRLVFQPQGGTSAGSNVTFVICDARGPAHARALVLANTGRIRQQEAPPSRAASDCI